MRSLEQLLNLTESALPFVTKTVMSHPGRCVMHPPSSTSADTLHRAQVSTRSPMGAIIYHTGGISVLGGWIRILGSGSPEIPRTLVDWNKEKSNGFCLIADDVFGGFFALDGGSLGKGTGEVFYFSPRSLEWEPLDCNYTQFLVWACSDFLDFYEDIMWTGCEEAISALGPDRCFFFHPPLWTTECSIPPDKIRDIPVMEVWGVQMDMARQLNQFHP